MSKVAIQRSSNPGKLGPFVDYMNQLYDKITQRLFRFLRATAGPMDMISSIG